MITTVDLSAIDSTYFQIIDVNAARIVFRSLSTGHFWCLLERTANGRRSFQIQHRHGNFGPYHIQKQRSSIEACCDYIANHDAFHIERERKKQKKKEQRKAVRHADQGDRRGRLRGLADATVSVNDKEIIP